METIKLKTNVRCNGCIAKVTPYLNGLKGVEKWNIDLNDPSRILTAEVFGITSEDIVAALQKAGYLAEKL